MLACIFATNCWRGYSRGTRHHKCICKGIMFKKYIYFFLRIFKSIWISSFCLWQAGLQKFTQRKRLEVFYFQGFTKMAVVCSWTFQSKPGIQLLISGLFHSQVWVSNLRFFGKGWKYFTFKGLIKWLLVVLGLFKVNLEFSFSFLDYFIPRSGFQTWDFLEKVGSILLSRV